MEKNGNLAERKKVDDEVHALRRRYVSNVTSQANEQRTGRENTQRKHDWEYQVVKGRWEIPEAERKARKIVCQRKCNRKSLRKTLKTNKKESVKGIDSEIEEAIES